MNFSMHVTLHGNTNLVSQESCYYARAETFTEALPPCDLGLFRVRRWQNNNIAVQSCEVMEESIAILLNNHYYRACEVK